MKRCPTCDRTYADDTTTFCLNDGSLLSAPYDPQATLHIPQARDTSPPPTLLMTGNQDDQVDWRDSLAMYMRLVDVGARCELHIFEGAPHAFDAQPEYGPRCIELAALFLGRHLLAAAAASSPPTEVAR